mgnify:FL=1
MVFRGHEITTGTANKGDALITLEITKSDGVKIEITSKVLVKYGQSIEKKCQGNFSSSQFGKCACAD